MLKRITTLLVLSVALVACTSAGDPPANPAPPGGNDPPPPPSGDDTTITYELKDGVYEATEATLAALRSFDPTTGRLVFGSGAAQAANLVPGDILLAGRSEQTPFGLLQRVIEVRTEGGELVVETEIAALDDAFEDLELELEQDLDFDDIVEYDLVEGVTLARVPDTSPLAEATLRKEVSLSRTLFSSSTGRVTAHGHLDVAIRAFVNLSIKTTLGVPTGVKRFDVGFNITESVDLRINADFDGFVVDQRLPLGTFRFGALCAGPVCVVPQLELYLGLDGQVSASLEFATQQELFFQVGAAYRDGRWSNLSDLRFSFDAGFPIVELHKTDTRAYIRVEGNLCLYGYKGACGGVFADLYLRYTYDRQANPTWELRGGLDVGVHARLDLKIWSTEYEKRWTIFERSLRRANFVPELSLLRPSAPQLIEVNEGIEDYFAVIIRDGDGPPATNPIVVRWESDVQGLLQEANATAYTRPGWQYAAYREAGALRLGHHLITITATDKEGDSDRVTFPVRVEPATPDPRIYAFDASPNPTPVGAAVVLTWDVHDTDRLALVRGADVLADLTSRSSFTTHPISARTTLTLRAENAAGTSTLDLVVDVLPVEVTLTPSSSTVFPDRRRDVSAAVTGAIDTDVTWSTSCGRLEAATPTSVTFVAPTSAGTCTLTAASVADPSAQAAATITVLPSPPVDPVLAAGVGHSLALTTNGHVYAWGSNAFGAVGNGTTTDATTPVRVPGIANARAVAASWHSLALLADGSVMTWGWIVPSDGTREPQTIPIPVAGLSDVVAIAAGGAHSLAVRDDGTVWAWGRNTSGQLGNGTMTDSASPVRVSDLERVIAVAATADASYALRSDGTVWSWGNNRRGQLGNGTTTSSTTPVAVTGLRDITALSAGPTGRYSGGYALALDRDGSVWAWGHNDGGQLGVSSQQGPQWCLEPGEDAIGACARTPFRTRGGGVAIAAGSRHALMIAQDGRVMAWGWTSDGAVGTTWDSHPFVEGLTQAVGIAAGSYHSLAVRSDGTVRAWGGNGSGALGNGTTVDSPVPVTTTIQGVGSP